VEESTDQHDFRIAVVRHIAAENALGPRLPPTRWNWAAIMKTASGAYKAIIASTFTDERE
jgi:hypothetical protein